MTSSPGLDVKCLEHATLKVPYEVLNKKFRAAQKVLDREATYVSQAGLEIEKLMSNMPPVTISATDPEDTVIEGLCKNSDSVLSSSTLENMDDASESNSNTTDKSSPSDEFKFKGRGPKGKDVSKMLGVLVERLVSLKRKAGDSIADELEVARAVRKRVQHLKGYNPTPEGVVAPVSQCLNNANWRRTRLNRMLVDHLLREGLYDTAKMLSEGLGIKDLTNIDLFWAAKEVEESLKRHETGRMVAWCYENKSKLRKIRSSLELEVRVQEFVELVRCGKRFEAVRHARKYLADTEGHDQMSAIMKCMGLLAYPADTAIQPYSELLSNDRWQYLIGQFRTEHARLYQLTPTSVLGAVVQAGLAALKTPQCYRPTTKNANCPVCTEPLSTLASVLPYAHCAHSQLVCAISGEPLNENNPPLVLPSGYVYGTKSLHDMARTNGGNVICPRSNRIFSLREADKVYVM
ncbi:unnamed protein product [Allacma fusca]|uniref:E3 ubiquitin-protein transferase MAEA n=1 Tax=Allacma fusca TaxID=39272 RepID=A0A8J2J1U4_9HEXA|nr:unnamed protein product [Allacma fusca]